VRRADQEDELSARFTHVLTFISATLIAATAAVVLPASPAGAATVHDYGRISTTLQHRDATITVTGWAFDEAHSSRSITACLAVEGRCVRRVYANRSSPQFDKRHHISGRHAFTARVPAQRLGTTLQLLAYDGHRTRLTSQRVLTPGARIVLLARHYVGNTRYVEGGSSPKSGFDCSGYTRWVYSHASVANLPHNAEAQRHISHMRRITRAQARPGDLVFYFSGGPAYHVAIYAGHGKQYAAATPRDGVRYQSVWSSSVEYRTDWH
jgi:cell wall-associated NlpC family hydrolase